MLLQKAREIDLWRLRLGVFAVVIAMPACGSKAPEDGVSVNMSFLLFSNSQRQPGWELHPIARFSDYLTTWDELNAQGPQSPLLSTDFVLPVINRFGRPNDLLAICRIEMTPIAMAILGPVGIGRWSTLNPILDPLQPPVAPLGLWVTHKDTQMTGILPQLLRKLPGFPLVLSVMNQDSRLSHRPIDAGTFNTIDHIKTPSIYMDGTFSDYWKNRKKHFKHDLRRRRSILVRSARIPRLKVLISGKPIDMAFDEFCRMENAGWKGRESVSLECNQDTKRCYREMWANFSKNGNARAYQYFYNDLLVATDLCLKSHQTLSILKTTYEEAEATTGPASLMREEQLHDIFEREKEIHRIEFYGPLMDWQKRWVTEVRTMYHLNCYRFNLLRKLMNKINRIRRRFKFRLSSQIQRSDLKDD